MQVPVDTLVNGLFYSYVFNCYRQANNGLQSVTFRFSRQTISGLFLTYEILTSAGHRFNQLPLIHCDLTYNNFHILEPIHVKMTTLSSPLARSLPMSFSSTLVWPYLQQIDSHRLADISYGPQRAVTSPPVVSRSTTMPPRSGRTRRSCFSRCPLSVGATKSPVMQLLTGAKSCKALLHRPARSTLCPAISRTCRSCARKAWM